MTEREDRFIKCLMCFGPDKESQKKLKDQTPASDCLICRGTGGLEVKFKKGIDPNEIRTTEKIGEAGYPIVVISAEYDK